MADRATEFLVERRRNPGDAWTTVASAYLGEALDIPDTNGMRAEYRVTGRNDAGRTAGESATVREVGTAKPGLRIPLGRFDDPPGGVGPLWAERQYFTKLPTGAAFYSFDRPEMAEDTTVDDPDAIDLWQTAKLYPEGDRVAFAHSVSTTAVDIVYANVYRATLAHTSAAANAPDEGGPWEFVRIHSTTFVPTGTTPDVPVEPGSESATGIVPLTTISMDTWWPETQEVEGFLQGSAATTAELIANDNGGYVFGSLRNGPYERYVTGADVRTLTTSVAVSLWDMDSEHWRAFHDSLFGHIALATANGETRKMVAQFPQPDQWIRFGLSGIKLSTNAGRCFFNVAVEAIGMGGVPDRPSGPSNGNLRVDFLFDVATPTVG